jgi:hypothetical protein
MQAAASSTDALHDLERDLRGDALQCESRAVSARTVGGPTAGASRLAWIVWRPMRRQNGGR